MPLAGLVTQGRPVSTFYRARAGLLCLLFTANERRVALRFLLLKRGSLRKWKPTLSFFSCLFFFFFFVASRNNPGLCRACLRIVVDPTPPTPTSGKTRLRAGVMGKLTGRRVTGLRLVSQYLEAVAC